MPAANRRWASRCRPFDSGLDRMGRRWSRCDKRRPTTSAVSACIRSCPVSTTSRPPPIRCGCCSPSPAPGQIPVETHVLSRHVAIERSASRRARSRTATRQRHLPDDRRGPDVGRRPPSPRRAANHRPLFSVRVQRVGAPPGEVRCVLLPGPARRISMSQRATRRLLVPRGRARGARRRRRIRRHAHDDRRPGSGSCRDNGAWRVDHRARRSRGWRAASAERPDCRARN